MNPARIALDVIGGLMLIIGGSVALAQNAAAKATTLAHSYDQAFGLSSPGDASPAASNYAGMWGGVVIAGFGALMLIGLLVAVAATTKEPPPAQIN